MKPKRTSKKAAATKSDDENQPLYGVGIQRALERCTVEERRYMLAEIAAAIGLAKNAREAVALGLVFDDARLSPWPEAGPMLLLRSLAGRLRLSAAEGTPARRLGHILMAAHAAAMAAVHGNDERGLKELERSSLKQLNQGQGILRHTALNGNPDFDDRASLPSPTLADFGASLRDLVEKAPTWGNKELEGEALRSWRYSLLAAKFDLLYRRRYSTSALPELQDYFGRQGCEGDAERVVTRALRAARAPRADVHGLFKAEANRAKRAASSRRS